MRPPAATALEKSRTLHSRSVVGPGQLHHQQRYGPQRADGEQALLHLPSANEQNPRGQDRVQEP